MRLAKEHQGGAKHPLIKIGLKCDFYDRDYARQFGFLMQFVVKSACLSFENASPFTYFLFRFSDIFRSINPTWIVIHFSGLRHDFPVLF